MVNAEHIRQVMADAVGNPGVGPVAEVLGTLADAVAADLNGENTAPKGKAAKVEETSSK